MKSSKVYEVEEAYRECQDCALGKNRIAFPHFGQGHPEGSVLIIVPHPVLAQDYQVNKDPQIYDSSPLQHGCHDYEMLTKITAKVDLTRDKLYIIPAVMCPLKDTEVIQREELDACRPRLKSAVSAFNPKLLVLCGPFAYYSFFGEKEKETTKLGKIYDKDDKVIYYTHSFRHYLKLKSSGAAEEEVAALASEVFSHWQEIAKLAG